MKALVTTIPFGERDELPINQLEQNGIEVTVNPFGRKVTEDELASIIKDYDYLVAGTEIISNKVIDNAENLKLISRVGIGLDGLDLNYAREKGIRITYTPEAPAPAVAELTLGLMLNCLRYVSVADREMRSRIWQRHFGRRISEIKIGIVGAGRIGKRVISHLAGFSVSQILVNDIAYDQNDFTGFNVREASKPEIFEYCDLVSLHIPLTPKSKNLVDANVLRSMKSDAILINTARGGIVNEDDLFAVMRDGHLSMVAIDVFETEPYKGELIELPNIILTSHMGSMSVDCRTRMEIEATAEVVRFHKNQSLACEVPEHEYQIQANVE